MNKRMFLIGLVSLLTLLLSACGSGSSWEEEEVVEVSNRIISDDVKVKWELEGDQASSLIRLRITNNGSSINDFEVNHEKLLHLIVVSEDLSYFTHIHPEYKGNGVFEIENEFPAGGKYRMIADFKPTNGNSMSKMEWVTVEGKGKQLEAITIDNSLEKVVPEGKVALLIEPQLESKKELTLKFTLTDVNTNQPLSDLEPYLGSIGHVVVLSEDGERYLHVHAIEGQGSGPVALFETEFTESGGYKIWAQFQRNGQVFTVPYIVNVP
ncbi:hypothetical protein ACLM5H_24765 [Fredinandcohnia humi]